MDFTVIYDAPLRAQSYSGRVAHKHDIRQQIEPQLKQLWTLPPLLQVRDYAVGNKTSCLADAFSNAISISPTATPSDWFVERNGAVFLPTVSAKQNMTAELNITWFRQEAPGGLLKVGDIDNRLKTLCDALQVPDANQMPEGGVTSDRSNPFHCVLEDDALISALNVKTERLLRPVTDEHQVLLIIQLVTRVHDVTLENLNLV